VWERVAKWFFNNLPSGLFPAPKSTNKAFDLVIAGDCQTAGTFRTTFSAARVAVSG